MHEEFTQFAQGGGLRKRIWGVGGVGVYAVGGELGLFSKSKMGRRLRWEEGADGEKEQMGRREKVGELLLSVFYVVLWSR